MRLASDDARGNVRRPERWDSQRTREERQSPANGSERVRVVVARLKERYKAEIVRNADEGFRYDNVMQVPKLEKIVVNIGLGEAIQNAKAIDAAVGDLTLITGQKPVVTRAKKSIAAFKLRAGMPIGAMVTLRGERMYEFLDRLIGVALPRIRDFRGVSPNRSTAAATTRSVSGSS